MSNDHTNAVTSEILAERERQREQWGDAHDDTHDEASWAYWIGQRVARLPLAASPRQQLVKVAAMALAAAESMDRRRIARMMGEDDDA